MVEWKASLAREEEFAGKAEGAAPFDAAEDASDHEKEILHRVLTVEPTTLAGVVALLEYVGRGGWTPRAARSPSAPRSFPLRRRRALDPYKMRPTQAAAIGPLS
jgi:hypothetical protein